MPVKHRSWGTCSSDSRFPPVLWRPPFCAVCQTNANAWNLPSLDQSMRASPQSVSKIISFYHSKRSEFRKELHYPPDAKCLDGHIASRWHTTQSCIVSLYKKLLTPQTYYIWSNPAFGEMSGEDCRLLSTIRCEWWNSATGFAIPGCVFDPLPAMICFSVVSHKTLPTMQQRLPTTVYISSS